MRHAEASSSSSVERWSEIMELRRRIGGELRIDLWVWMTGLREQRPSLVMKWWWWRWGRRRFVDEIGSRKNWWRSLPLMIKKSCCWISLGFKTTTRNVVQPPPLNRREGNYILLFVRTNEGERKSELSRPLIIKWGGKWPIHVSFPWLRQTRLPLSCKNRRTSIQKGETMRTETQVNDSQFRCFFLLHWTSLCLSYGFRFW